MNQFWNKLIDLKSYVFFRKILLLVFLRQIQVVRLESRSCIYNPYLGGFFRDNYGSPNNMRSLGLTPAENSCIPKLLIDSCDDYKTKENCNNDRGYGEHKRDIKLNCEWVESSNFSEGYFSDISGICVVKEELSSEIIRMNKKHYPDRLNLIKNPSFEYHMNSDDPFGWDNGREYNRDGSREGISDAYHGSYVYSLSGGDSLSHTFYFPGNAIKLMILIYMLAQRAVLLI